MCLGGSLAWVLTTRSLLSFLELAVIVPNKAVKTNKTKQIKQYLPERLQ